MAKGKAQKRRAKNAIKANYSNLHKAQRGRASATVQLPRAPTKNEFEDYIPRGLRKLQALKEAAEQAEQAKRRKLSHQGSEPPPQEPDQTPSQPQHPPEVPDPEAADGTDGDPTIAPDAGKHDAAKPRKLKNVGLEAPIPYEDEHQGRSEKKKLYRKQLRERHKAKAKGKHAEELGTASQGAAAGKPAFGEQAAAPPQISLKRRHWSEQDVAKRSNERCKQIFLKQLETARKQASVTGLVDAGVALKKKPLQDKEQEAVRAQVIEAYRAKKKQQGGKGAATRTTLAALVKHGQQSMPDS